MDKKEPLKITTKSKSHEPEEEAPAAKKTRKEEEEKKKMPEDGEEDRVGVESRPFSEFDISDETATALRKIGVEKLFPVQAKTFDAIMTGKDVLVQARTGSGKTLAFAIPIMEKLAKTPGVQLRGRGPRAVVFCPTRELAIQVRDVLASISRNYIVAALYGGVAYATQERALFSGVDVVVATPGRAKDFLEKKTLKFDRVVIVTLDEADHMLDIGFKDDIEALLATVARQNGSKPDAPNHQTLLFSATVPEWVHSSRLISSNKVFVDMVGKDTVRTASTIRFFRRKCLRQEVSSMLADLIRVYSGKHGRALVFTNTKRDCHDLCVSNSKLDAQTLHGDMQQEQRESTMKSFRENKFSVLIATDVAARGLDLPMVDLVIQAAPPTDMDAFIHRAGRTGRAGRKGVCVLLHQPREDYIVEKIERHGKMKFELLPSPSQEEILQAVARDVTEDLARVERKATEMFRKNAEEILKEADPVEILASALAVMSGYTTSINKRGLLTGLDRHVTILVKSNNPLPVPVYCSILRNALGIELFNKCKDISVLQDEPGCAFDTPEADADLIVNTPVRGFEMTITDKLPPTVARVSTGMPSRGGFRGGVGGFGFGRGGGFRGGPPGRGGFGGRGGSSGSNFRGGGGFGFRGGPNNRGRGRY